MAGEALEPLLHQLRATPPPLPLHLPAHGRGRGLAPGLQRLLRDPAGRWDLPELPGFGGPLEPEGAVAEAQRRAAARIGAELCRFGVNGASGLLQVALLGLCPPGSRLLLPRQLHRSLLHACVLGQLEPLLYSLPFEPRSGLWLPPDAAWLERVLAAAAALPGPPPSALVLVSPTYHGLEADLAPLVAASHRAGLPVLVDQAHGHGRSAVAADADLTVVSLQKAAGGLAQAAALFARLGRLEAAGLDRALLWLQTSSPSALLLAAAAAALDEAASSAGGRRRARAHGRAALLRHRLEAQGLALLANQDPLRLVWLCGAAGINGLEADAWLLERGVVAELPEPGSLTFCLGQVPPPRLERLLPRRLSQLVAARGGAALPAFTPPPLPLLAGLDLPLGQAWRATAQSVPLVQAAGRIAAEPLCPYPPGIPLLVPGERIDAERAAWLGRQALLWPGQIADTVKVVAEMHGV
jgi:lysine decarboxylase